MAKKLYTVQQGDYLEKIAMEQLGDRKRWSEIAYINELKQPYMIRTNDVLLLPDDSEALEVVITKGVREQDKAAAVTKQAALTVTPATVALGLLAVAAFIFLWDD